MQIKLLGTGSILTEHLSACSIIDGKIMLDCPNGVMKAMRKMGIVPTKADICLITHFHADHFFDIPFLLLEQGLRNIRENDFVIIGPKSLADRIEGLFNMAYPEDWEKIKDQSKLKTIEIANSEQKIVVNDYTITPYKVDHVGYDAYGYVIEKEGKCVGFTGDTIACPNVEKIIQSSALVFADMSFEKNSKGHMGLNDIKDLMDKYGYKCRIIPTHMTDGVRKIFSEQFFKAPTEGEEFSV